MINRRLILSGLVLCAVGGVASAATLTFTMDQSFGAVAPSGWPTITFEDLGADTVRITMDLSAFTGTEKVPSWYLNTAYYLDPTLYAWVYDASSTGPMATVDIDPTWNTNDAGRKADGDGYHDIRLDFPNTGGNNFGPGEKVIYTVTGSGLDVFDFDVLGNAGDSPSSPGPYRSVVRVRSTGADGEGSDWIGDGDEFTPFDTVPEPGTLALLGTDLLGLGQMIRRRRR